PALPQGPGPAAAVSAAPDRPAGSRHSARAGNAVRPCRRPAAWPVPCGPASAPRRHSAARAAPAADARRRVPRHSAAASVAAPACGRPAAVRPAASARLLVPATGAQALAPALDIATLAQVGGQQVAQLLLAPDTGTAQQRLQVLDPVALAQQQRAGLLQVDQLRGKAAFAFAQEDMLGIEAAVHLPGTVQAPRQLAAGAQDA